MEDWSFLMNEADILETTYEDSCIIERLTDIEDSNTNITIQDYKKYMIILFLALFHKVKSMD